MRKAIAVLTTISFLLLPVTANAAAPKAGAKCAKLNQSQSVDGSKFTCVKSGTKLVWKKVGISGTSRISDSAGTQNSYLWTSVCDPDPWVPAEWANYQKFALRNFGCARPYRFVDVALPTENPKSSISAEVSAINVCKIPERPESQNIGFRQNGFQFSGDITIQVIPIQFSDFKASGSPEKEYGRYFTYIKEMFYKLSDGNTRITFRTPENFISMGKTLESYVRPGYVTHGNMAFKNIDVRKYQNDLFSVVDPLIDFSGISMAAVIVPLSVPGSYIPHGPEFRMDNVSTSEGNLPYNYLWPSAAEVDRTNWYGVEPFLHLHEFMHANGLLNDHLGDEMGRTGPQVGTGTWGHMSGMQTDFILWDKWLSGMLKDSQVICSETSSPRTYWIKPAGIFGEYQKLLVIPLSNSKVIAIESKRAAGLDFKLNKLQQGALVMVVDSTKSGHAVGIDVIRPPMRTGSIYSTTPGGFVYEDAPLKQGESMVVEGYKITVVESGTFGDVIKVEKA